MTRCRDETILFIDSITGSFLSRLLPAGFVSFLHRGVKAPWRLPADTSEQPPPRQPQPLLKPGPCATLIERQFDTGSIPLLIQSFL